MKSSLLLSLLILSLPTFAADPVIEKAVANPQRTADDRERDARDKPAEIMEFAGVKPGMVVADIFSAGGYWTELLSNAVGPTGKVLAINNVAYAQYSKDDRKARYTEGRLPNVEHHLIEASWFNMPQKVDLVVIFMAYHDVYWVGEKDGWPEISTASTRTGRRRASSRTASSSTSRMTACATRTTRSTRWFTTRRSRARRTVTSTSTT